MLQNVGSKMMKRTIIIDTAVLALALPAVVAVAKWSGATQTVWQLTAAALNPFSTGILTNNLAQALILVGPLWVFLFLTVLAIIKEKRKTSCVLTVLTSACRAFLMFGTLFREIRTIGEATTISTRTLKSRERLFKSGQIHVS